MAVFAEARTAVANTAGTLLDPGYAFRATVQNHLSDFLWLSATNPPTMGAPSICVPKANTQGPGEYTFDTDTTGPWYYKTGASGSFAVIWWPAG